MKKFDNLTVRELLHIEDGYYKLENPIAYAMDGGGGEISGVISIDTKTNSTDGILKVITAMSDDTSYYVDNIWQDGDALAIAEKDEGSGSGGGEGGGDDKLSDIVFKCDGQTLGTATCNYEVSSVWDMSADVLPVFKLVLLTSDDYIKTTLYGTSASFDVGQGGYTIGVNFILDSGASYRVVGRGNGGTWTVSKQF